MDKLRAMEYLVRVVEAGSFAAAARELDVSPPAVTKLISALEHELGTPLLRRNSRHLSLTSDGEQFFPVCASALEDLRAAEARLAVNRTGASGKLIVGMPTIVGEHLVAPFLPEFLRRHPELTFDLRVVNFPTERSAALVDVLLLIGWPEASDMVAKCIAQTRFVTCASPAYWQVRGIPRDPNELLSHDCLAHRSPRGVVLDLWKYRRGDEVRSVAVEPRIVSDERDWMVQAALRGLGVVRLTDVISGPLLEQGVLQAALEDWEGLEAPPLYVLYRRGMRSSTRVRAFVDFVTALFADLETSRRGAWQTKASAEPMPAWWRSKWVGPLSRRARNPSGPSTTAGTARS